MHEIGLTVTVSNEEGANKQLLHWLMICFSCVPSQNHETTTSHT